MQQDWEQSNKNPKFLLGTNQIILGTKFSLLVPPLSLRLKCQHELIVRENKYIHTYIYTFITYTQIYAII